MLRLPSSLVLASLLLTASAAEAQLWQDVTDSTIGSTREWSNKVDLADVNGDGLVDILFANGGNYDRPGTPEQNRVFLNQGAGNAFVEASDQVFGSEGDIARSLKARDINGDGFTDIFVGTTYQSQSRLYLGDGSGGYTEVTDSLLPQRLASVGDVEVGDIDGDGDMDLALADWGPGNPFDSAGGQILIWLQEEDGSFRDATAQAMPNTLVRWSWDMELIDTDNDYDLDIVASCKVCTGSHYFVNDGEGRFSDARERMPQFTNNYEFEPIDINQDGFFDLVTINDGEELSGQFDRREHVFMNDGQGGYTDGGTAVWPDAANIGADDNAVVVLDVDSDGDGDFLIASLGTASDRLLINEGGTLRLETETFSGSATQGTLGIAVADLNGDGKLDVVQSQGELAEDERVYFGVDVAVDTAGPIVQMVSARGSADGMLVRARVHDNKTPVMDYDFKSVEARIEKADGSSESAALRWYGGSLWRLDGDPLDVVSVQVCATDAAGNESCSDPVEVSNDGSCDRCDGNGNGPGGDEDGGCSTTGSTSGGSSSLLLGGLLGLVALRRRRKSRA